MGVVPPSSSPIQDVVLQLSLLEGFLQALGHAAERFERTSPFQMPLRSRSQLKAMREREEAQPSPYPPEYPRNLLVQAIMNLDCALRNLPPEVNERLNTLTGRPWAPTVRKECFIRPWLLLNQGPSNDLRKLIDRLKHHRLRICNQIEDFELDLYTVQADSDPSTKQDGPDENGYWRYNGKLSSSHLVNMPGKLARFLFESRTASSTNTWKPVDFRDLAKPVWNDSLKEITAQMVDSHSKVANRFFDEKGIPYHIRVSRVDNVAVLTLKKSQSVKKIELGNKSL